MMHWHYLLAMVIVAGCGGGPADTSSPDAPVAPVTGEEVLLITTVDHLRLRASADTEAEVTGSLREGTPVMWQGEQSAHHTTVTLRGKELAGPWYAIKTASGLQGWVFSGALAAWQPYSGTPYAECLALYNRAEFSSFYPCLERISQQLSGPEQAQATSTYLRLRLANGQTRQWDHVLKPGPNYRLYQYLGKLRHPEMHVIKINRQGGSSFIAVHPYSGQSVDVSGIPQPLAMSRSVLCLGPQPDEPGSTRLEILHVDERQIRTTLQESLPGMAFTALSWYKNGTPNIRFRDREGRTHTYDVAHTGPDQWKLNHVK